MELQGFHNQIRVLEDEKARLAKQVSHNLDGSILMKKLAYQMIFASWSRILIQLALLFAGQRI